MSKNFPPLCFLLRVLACNFPRNVQGIIWNWPPYVEGRRDIDHSSLVSGSGKKQGNLHMRFVLGSCKVSLSVHPPLIILPVYAVALTVFSYLASPDWYNNTFLSKFCIFGIAGSRAGKQTTRFQDRGGGEEPSVAQV